MSFRVQIPYPVVRQIKETLQTISLFTHKVSPPLTSPPPPHISSTEQTVGKQQLLNEMNKNGVFLAEK